MISDSARAQFDIALACDIASELLDGKEPTMMGESTASQLWTMPLEELAQVLIARVTREDERTVAMKSALLSARVALEVATTQEKTTRELVEASHALVEQTRNLTRATIGVVIVTGISALVVAIIGAFN